MSPFDPLRGGGRQKGTMSPFLPFFLHESVPKSKFKLLYKANFSIPLLSDVGNLFVIIVSGVPLYRMDEGKGYVIGLLFLFLDFLFIRC